MPEFIILGMFCLVGFLLYLGFNAIRYTRQTTLHKALLERFASAQDLAAFLETSAGQRFLAELSSGAASPFQSVLGSIQNGILALFLGAGFFPLGGAFKDGRVVMGIGIVLILVGFGFLTSALVTYLLSRWWGLLPGRSKPPEK